MSDGSFRSNPDEKEAARYAWRRVGSTRRGGRLRVWFAAQIREEVQQSAGLRLGVIQGVKTRANRPLRTGLNQRASVGAIVHYHNIGEHF